MNNALHLPIRAGSEHADVRLLCCYAAVQREGTRSQFGVYFSHSRGSCETVQANGAVCPYIRLVPGARGDSSGDRLAPDPVWKSALIPLLPRPLLLPLPVLLWR